MITYKKDSALKDLGVQNFVLLVVQYYQKGWELRCPWLPFHEGSYICAYPVLCYVSMQALICAQLHEGEFGWNLCQNITVVGHTFFPLLQFIQLNPKAANVKMEKKMLSGLNDPQPQPQFCLYLFFLHQLHIY